ncbi:1957_t:CDS:10 [Funneliformis caledonium]|uniref:1957_t:CDS:1 n=1 Tax=Funneliformis caledonium TaxID=1117310 RepID=A0A9N8VC88_9GLOM|nr:1957_t:CDS:10 [Funneliformis caledonium]
MDVKQERKAVVEAIFRNKCDNYLYEYLIKRKDQTSFTKDAQAEYDGSDNDQMTFAKQEYLLVTLVMICWFNRSLTSSKQEHLLVALMEKKMPAIIRFWKIVAEERETESAIRSASLGHLNIFGKYLLSMLMHRKHQKKRENEAEGSVSRKKRITLTSADARTNRDHNPPSDFNYVNCEEGEYYDARKRHQILYSWKDAINKIDFRNTSKKDVNKIFQRQLPSSLPPVVNNMTLEYSSMLNSFTPLSNIQDVWYANFSKVAELNDQDKDKFCQAQIILRNFLLLSSSSKGVNTNNEDTFVHEILHNLLKEIFRDSMFELIWQTARVLFQKISVLAVLAIRKTLEILFGEAKLKDSSSLLINKDFVKLSNFQADALDELIKRYGNRIGLTSFSIWVCGARIRIYKMDINYDRIYRMFLTANVITPTEQAQFLSLISVLEALYNVKDCISETLKVIASNTPPSSPSRSTYCRMLISSPKPVKA